MKIKPFTLLLFIVFGFFASCNNDDNSNNEFESTAKITGLDLTLCACCGGWIINISGEDPDKRFTNLPQSSNIDLENATLPINVKLNWSESNDYCGKGILIESIKLIQ